MANDTDQANEIEGKETPGPSSDEQSNSWTELDNQVKRVEELLNQLKQLTGGTEIEKDITGFDISKKNQLASLYSDISKEKNKLNDKRNELQVQKENAESYLKDYQKNYDKHQSRFEDEAKNPDVILKYKKEIDKGIDLAYLLEMTEFAENNKQSSSIGDNIRSILSMVDRLNAGMYRVHDIAKKQLGLALHQWLKFTGVNQIQQSSRINPLSLDQSQTTRSGSITEALSQLSSSERLSILASLQLTSAIFPNTVNAHNLPPNYSSGNGLPLRYDASNDTAYISSRLPRRLIPQHTENNSPVTEANTIADNQRNPRSDSTGSPFVPVVIEVNNWSTTQSKSVQELQHAIENSQPIEFRGVRNHSRNITSSNNDPQQHGNEGSTHRRRR